MATKFYLHRGTYGEPGTYPGGTALGGTPTVSASGASTNRWMDTTISAVAQTSATTTTDGTTNAQTAWHTRHISAPLAAQTISAQTLTYSLAASEANAGSNFNPTIYVSLWRPGTGTEVGAIMAVGTITATEPGTSQTATSGTGTSTQQIAQAGDVIVVETWRKSVAPGATTARTNVTFYDGTTEASTTNVATFVNFANTLTFQARVAAPSAASATLTGATPTVVATDNKTAAPTAATLSATGGTPTVTVTANQLAVPTAASMTLTGSTPVVVNPVSAAPTAASASFSLGTPAVVTPVASVPSGASLVLSAATPTITQPVASLPTAGALVASGATPVVAVTDHKSAVPDALSLGLTGATPVVAATDHKQLIPSAATLTLTGFPPEVPVGDQKIAQPTPVELTLTASTPTVTVTTVSADRVSLPSAAHLALVGKRPSVMVSGGQPKPRPRAQKATFRPIKQTRSVPRPASMVLVPAVPDVLVFDPHEAELLIMAGLI